MAATDSQGPKIHGPGPGSLKSSAATANWLLACSPRTFPCSKHMSILFQNNFQRGFGTFPLHGEEAIAAVGEAINVGYRAFDTAQMYGNEAEVGQALANCGVDRKELCITTKVPTQRFSSSDFIPSVERSLKDLQVDYVDLLLLHWPPADGNIAPSLRLLAEAHSKGLARNIGVSNYTSKMMREAAATADVPLATNQVEFHPLLNQEILLTATAETGITLSALSLFL